MANKKLEKPELVVGPHETIRELMQNYNMNVNELALRLNRSQPKTSELVNGKVLISPETAKKLERVFGVSTEFWLNYTDTYREYLKSYRDYEEKAKITNDEKNLVCSKLYKQLDGRGYVETVCSIHDKVVSLRSFFGVADLRRLPELYMSKFAYSMKKEAQSDLNVSAFAWIRIVEIKAREMNLSPYSKKMMKANISRIRKLSQTENPKDFLPQLTEILAKCGVAFIIEPETYNAKIYGLTYWLSKSKPVIALSFRRKFLDSFWFALFHEIGHLLLHENKNILELQSDGLLFEDEANSFAAETLIPKEEYEQMKSSLISSDSIIKFSKKVGIHPSIVVGRLKHDKLLGYDRFCNLQPKCDLHEDMSSVF